MRRNSFCCPTAAAVAILFACQAEAHFVWIETQEDGEGVAVRAGFGEVASWEAEYAPKIAGSSYWVVRPETKPAPIKLTWNEEAECYSGKTDAKATAVVGRSVWGLFGRGGTTESLVIYYPKAMIGQGEQWGKVGPLADAKVEIVPKRHGSEVLLTVLVDGKPSEGAKVKLYAPDADKQEADTDAEGKASFPAKEVGLYSVSVVHRTDEKGEHEGMPYEGVMHCATLTFRVGGTTASAN